MTNSSQSNTQRKRSVLFWLFVVISIPLITVVVGYASGYRFDTQSKKLSITSLISLYTVQEGASVTLNGVVQEKTTPFMQSVLPGEYTVTIQRDGYQPWKKTATVEEGKSAVFSKILLFAQTPTIEEQKDAIEKPIGLRPLTEAERELYTTQGFTHGDTASILTGGPQVLLVDPQLNNSWIVPKNGSQESALRIADAVTVAEWNSDQSELLMMNEQELWVYTLEKNHLTLLRRQSTPLIDATWSVDATTIFYSDPATINAIERDDRGDRQRWIVATLANATDLIAQKKELLFTVDEQHLAIVLIP